MDGKNDMGKMVYFPCGSKVCLLIFRMVAMTIFVQNMVKKPFELRCYHNFHSRYFIL